MERTQGHRHNLTLDAMRGVAALGVVWYHLHFVVNYDSAGPLAVDFFFLLSGFVVAGAYDDRIDRNLDFLHFSRKRLVRMYPLFLLGLIFALAVQELLIGIRLSRLGQSETLLSFLVELFWIPSPFSRDGVSFPLDGPAWSLSFEILVNILYAFFHRHLTSRTLVLISLLAGVSVVVAVVMRGTINFGWSRSTLPLGLARVLFSFPLGVLLWRCREYIPAKLDRIPPWLLLGMLAVILALPEARFTDIMFLLFGAPFLVASGYRRGGSENAGIFRFLGEASYPLYALHGPTILLVQGLVKRLHLAALALPIALGYLLTMLFLSRAVATADLAFRRGLDRFIDDFRQPARGPSVTQ